jgi:phytoene dehydrogenase-like protein
MRKASSKEYDTIVVGAGPNGLAAAITLAKGGLSVLLLEARDTIGGGTRSAELTLPGFIHDVCSTILGLGNTSPFFRSISLHEYGVQWVYPPAPLAHPLDDGSAVILERSLEETGEGLGEDSTAYKRLLKPFVNNWDKLTRDLLGPLPLPPRHPILMARFGLKALWPAQTLAKMAFKGERARALFAGLAGHSMISLEKPITAAFGLMLNANAHVSGFPIVAGGAQKFSDALGCYLQSLGGKVITNKLVESIDELPSARAYLLDVTPRQLIDMAGDRLPSGYRKRLKRYRYGPGVFKVDFALDGPIPWRAEECLRAATVHVGGSFQDIVAAEKAVEEGRHPEKPFVLLVQASLFDPSRAPAGKHTVWAYCHVPNGSKVDMTHQIEDQIERFAPGFRQRILARHTFTAEGMEQYNPNYIGGDINGGTQDIWQLFTRPTARWVPYSTPAKDIFICSSSTPPGGGVHGMSGYHAAQAAMRSISNQ